MDEIKVIPIDIKRFNAFAAHTRSPAAAYMSEELEWFADEKELVLGILIRDYSDNDFAGIILGRDEGGRFRCFDQKVSIETKEKAKEWIDSTIKIYVASENKEFPQGDTTKPLDLFTPVVPLKKLHPSFRKLFEEDSFLPAKRMISEIMPHYVDVDGNFVEQFQTTGFDARLWELYIHSYLIEEQLFFNREYDRPDFFVTKYGKSVAIEATTVGRSKDNPEIHFQKKPLNAAEVARRQENEMPIKFGSPLFSKLKKKYWELKHLNGLPLVFAIADFHDDQSMLWTSTALHNYLYGIRHEFHHDDHGNLIIEPLKIATHKVGEKEIPSGFFFQPDAVHVSAVMFSAQGTISKFNRLGRQAGFVAPNVMMIRFGTYHDHNPNAHFPKEFGYIVTEKCEETWAEGLSMFHNPRAIHPVPEELFPSIAHHHFKDGQIVSKMPEFHPYASQTLHLKAKD